MSSLKNDQQETSIKNCNINSRFDSGLPASADAETNAAFAQHCCAVYNTETWNGFVLSEYFRTDFEPFTNDDFVAVPDTRKRRLRDLLCNCGVLVARGCGIPVANALFEAAQNELYWSADDNDRPLTHVTKISNTLHLNRKSKEKDDSLSTIPVFKRSENCFLRTCSKQIHVTRTATMAPLMKTLHENLLCTSNSAAKTLLVKSQNF